MVSYSIFLNSRTVLMLIKRRIGLDGELQYFLELQDGIDADQMQDWIGCFKPFVNINKL